MNRAMVYVEGYVQVNLQVGITQKHFWPLFGYPQDIIEENINSGKFLTMKNRISFDRELGRAPDNCKVGSWKD